MKKDAFFTVFMDILLIIIFLALGRMVMNLSGADEIKHMTIMFVLLLFAAITLFGVYRSSKSSWSVMLFIVLLTIIEVFWVYFLHKVHFVWFVLYIILLLITFGITVIKVVASTDDECDECESCENTTHSLPSIEDENAFEEIVAEPHSVVLKSNEPGKYVASKTGTTYHAPKCDWAKRIKKQNMVWFDDDKEAKKQGYKRHDCLK